MLRDKRSFFERLTGAVKIDDSDDGLMDMDVPTTREDIPVTQAPRERNAPQQGGWYGQAAVEEEEEGQLTVDVYQDQNDIIVKTMVAGVKPEDLDVSISRDMVTIKGKRESGRTVNDDDYFHKELYWGSFSRTIVLPNEIDPDAAEAVEKHGLLIIRLPKLDKGRSTRLRVKTQ